MTLKKLSERIELFAEGATVREPPKDFRISKAGLNTTLNGPYVFDAKAAESVLEAFAEHGAILPIDYDHLMLDPFAPPGGGIAAGWFKPEVRDGELWAASVIWTPSAAQKLRDLEYRYISPAFYTDSEERMVRLINCAITNLPATHGLDALVAAREALIQAPPSGGSKTMTDDEKTELLMCHHMGIKDVAKYRAFKASRAAGEAAKVALRAAGMKLDGASFTVQNTEGAEPIELAMCAVMGIKDVAKYRAFKASRGPVQLAPSDDS